MCIFHLRLEMVLINIDYCLKSRSKTYSYGDVTTATLKPSMLGAYDL